MQEFRSIRATVKRAARIELKCAIAAIAAFMAISRAPAQAGDQCPGIVKYVCAVKDGRRVTYVNSCVARADAGTHILLGKCENETISQMQFRPEQLIPVCASRNGAPTTYGNACIAIADGVTILHKGGC